MRKVLKVLAWAIAGVIAIAFIAGLIGYWTSTNACDEHKIAPRGALMKAIVYCDYGSPDVLKLQDVAKPSAGADQVLVKVRAAAVNPLHWHYICGTPYRMRIHARMRNPKAPRPGADLS